MYVRKNISRLSDEVSWGQTLEARLMWPTGNPGAPAQVEALRHSATNNGGRRRRERELEVPVQVQVARRDNAGDRVLLDEADGEEPGG